MEWDWAYAREILPLLLSGLKVTVIATVLGAAVAAVLGLVFALLRRSSNRIVARTAGFLVQFIRGTPLLVQLYFIFYVLTDIGIRLPALAAGVIAVLMAQQVRAPALTFVMAGVIPLVPGSRIYAGLLLIGTDLTAGAAKLFEAGEVAVALAAGAVLGIASAAAALTAAAAAPAPGVRSVYAAAGTPPSAARGVKRRG